MTELLRSGPAADYLNITEYQLYNKTREGIIPAVRIGRQLRWSKEALDEFIQSGGKGFDGEGGWRKNA
jgi:excisionase family DNA binding protein